MPNIPAFCDNCGAMYPSGLIMENVRQAKLSGNRSTCPSCGSLGRIPDGLYSVVGNTIELISGPERTYRDLERLAAVLKEARAQGATVAEIAQAIRKETPELTSVGDLLPKSRAELYAFIGIILSAIAILLSQCASPRKRTQPILNVNVEQVINQAVSAQTAERPTEAARVEKGTGKEPVGRNDPCPCGSGKKYKRCHGAMGER